MVIKMYTEPLIVLCDYIFTMERKHRCLELWFPIVSGIICGVYLYKHDIDTYVIVEHVQSIITTLLGFTLAAMAIFIAGGDKCELTKEYATDKTLRGKTCTLYDLMILNYSYQVIVEFVLCVAYIIGLCLPNLLPSWLATGMNVLYIVFALSVSLSTLRSVTDLYWIFIAKNRE